MYALAQHFYLFYVNLLLYIDIYCTYISLGIAICMIQLDDLYSDCILIYTLFFSARITYIEIPFTTKLTNYNIHTFRKKRKMRRANKKYCSAVHNTCICIQTLRREQSQRLRDTEICSSIIPCMRKIRHFCLTLNYP